MTAKLRTPAWVVGGALSAMLQAALGAGIPAQVQSASAQLTIRVENVSARGGTLRIALYDRDRYPGHNQPPLAASTVEARAPETVVVLSNLWPGVYAVKMFQDFDRIGVFKKNALGYPQEPFGFSNDALSLLDQPDFDAAKFKLSSGENTIVVHLRFLP